MVDFEDIVEPEWLAWYRKTPEERFRESQELFAHYRKLGGSLDPDVHNECPFWSREDLEGFARSVTAARRQAGLSLTENAGQ